MSKARKKAVFSWSTGKDSALALHRVLSAGIYEIQELITTVGEEYNRVSMHGVRTTLLEEQARSIGLPLNKILIPSDCTNDTYEDIMKEAMSGYSDMGIETVIFADLFLGDIRAYREKQLARIGMLAEFPVWDPDTGKIADTVIRSGFKSVITCVDSTQLTREYCGRDYDIEFINSLPEGVDPCGENGEFHTFTYSGPVFHKDISFKKGVITQRDERFYYCDLLPV